MWVAGAGHMLLGRVGDGVAIVAPFGISLPDVLRNSNSQVAYRDRDLLPRLRGPPHSDVTAECVASVVECVVTELCYGHEDRLAEPCYVRQLILDDFFCLP